MDIDTALHELLLTRPVTESDIVQAHRRMAMRFHPDKAADPDEKRWAQQKFVQVQEAYELLRGLPIDTINGSPDRKVSQETSGGPRQQSKGCSAQQPRHEEPHPSQKLADSIASLAGKVLILCCCFATGFVGLPLMFFMICSVSTPQRLSGSPVPARKDSSEDAAATKEFQQTFGRLLRIGRGPKGDRFAIFERVNQPVYDDQVICGFIVFVRSDDVVFFRLKEGGFHAQCGGCSLSQ
jgi:hypothetical protein